MVRPITVQEFDTALRCQFLQEKFAEQERQGIIIPEFAQIDTTAKEIQIVGLSGSGWSEAYLLQQLESRGLIPAPLPYFLGLQAQHPEVLQKYGFLGCADIGTMVWLGQIGIGKGKQGFLSSIWMPHLGGPVLDVNYKDYVPKADFDWSGYYWILAIKKG